MTAALKQFSGQVAESIAPALQSAAVQLKKNRFFGTVSLDENRAGRDAGKVAVEVIEQLIEAGTKVSVRLEIAAQFPGGADDDLLAAISENCKSLKFKPFGFETE